MKIPHGFQVICTAVGAVLFCSATSYAQDPSRSASSKPKEVSGIRALGDLVGAGALSSTGAITLMESKKVEHHVAQQGKQVAPLRDFTMYQLSESSYPVRDSHPYAMALRKKVAELKAQGKGYADIYMWRADGSGYPILEDKYGLRKRFSIANNSEEELYEGLKAVAQKYSAREALGGHATDVNIFYATEKQALKAKLAYRGTQALGFAAIAAAGAWMLYEHSEPAQAAAYDGSGKSSASEAVGTAAQANSSLKVSGLR